MNEYTVTLATNGETHVLQVMARSESGAKRKAKAKIDELYPSVDGAKVVSVEISLKQASFIP